MNGATVLSTCDVEYTVCISLNYLNMKPRVHNIIGGRGYVIMNFKLKLAFPLSPHFITVVLGQSLGHSGESFGSLGSLVWATVVH